MGIDWSSSIIIGTCVSNVIQQITLNKKAMVGPIVLDENKKVWISPIIQNTQCNKLEELVELIIDKLNTYTRYEWGIHRPHEGYSLEESILGINILRTADDSRITLKNFQEMSSIINSVLKSLMKSDFEHIYVFGTLNQW